MTLPKAERTVDVLHSATVHNYNFSIVGMWYVVVITFKLVILVSCSLLTLRLPVVATVA